MDPNPDLKKVIDDTAQAHIQAARLQMDWAVLLRPAAGYQETALGVNGTGCRCSIQGCAIGR